jgi:hypothetical protein
MPQFKRYLVAGCCLTILAITGALMNTHHAVAQAPTQVAVVNTPLPITGDVHIAASAHRPLAVEIAHVPVPVLNVSEPGQAPYQESREFTFGAGGCGPTFCGVTFGPVPAGKRLVVTQISGLFQLPTGRFPLIVFPLSLNSGVPATKQGTDSATGFDYFVSNQAILGYFDSSAPPTMQVSEFGGTPGPRPQIVTLAGYYVGL